jgi:hypothetical protein
VALRLTVPASLQESTSATNSHGRTGGLRRDYFETPLKDITGLQSAWDFDLK